MRARFAILAVAGLAIAGAAGCGGGDDETTLTVMSFNIEGGGTNANEPPDEWIAAIEAANPDIVGLQETRALVKGCTANVCPPEGPSVVGEMAEALGYEYYDQPTDEENWQPTGLWGNAILSRYPIEGPTANHTGVEIDVDGRSVYAYNVHLDDSPCQPYQIVEIEYGRAPFIDSEDEAIRSAEETRGPAIETLTEDLTESEDAAAAFVFGDFNEPSAHDWTADAVEAGQQPLEVAWPTTMAVEDEGFVDTYREVHPDPVAEPGFTWTPTTKPTDPDDHHDRIDFVLARGDDLKVEDAEIVGEKEPEADIVVDPFPSDHRAVMATVEF
jgi:endonuclease/exonuclease/phosphatase family metal-dependent hydrolase